MSASGFDPEAFRSFEVAGWEERAATYDGFFGRVTSRAIEPLLDAAHVGGGSRVLDVGTGPGYVAAQAAARGAATTGVDIAAHMVELAARLHPANPFQQADAEQLPFADSCFDTVVGNFIVLHLACPEQAVAELTRVLVPGGWLALTTWDLLERSRLQGVLVEAIQSAGASPPPDLPPGPPQYLFAEEAEFAHLLESARLAAVEVHTVAFTQSVAGPPALWEGLLSGGVRIPPMILRQPQDVQRRIRTAYERLVAAYAVDTGLAVPVSVKWASGRKATARNQGPYV